MRDEYEITTSIQILIDDALPVYPAEVVQWDMNVTVPKDLLECNLRLLQASGKDRLISPDAQIPAGCDIQQSVIGAGVTIRHPIRITRSLIMPNTVLEIKRDVDGIIAYEDNVIQCSLSEDKPEIE